MFDKVKTIAVVKPAAARKERATETLTGWESLCALTAATQALSGLLELRKNQIKDVIRDRLVATGLAKQTKPDSLSPVEGMGKGSAYLSKRSTNSPLSPDEVELIAATVGDAAVENFVETTERLPSLLTINPEYLPGGARYDAAKMAKIEKLLEKEAPDFIVRTEAETRVTVSEEALPELFRQPANIVEALLPVLATTAVRPVFGGSLEDAWNLIRPLVPEAAAAAEAALKRSRK